MRAAGPVVDPVRCSGCGKLIDPLRAGHVGIFDRQYHFFCSYRACRSSFLQLPHELEPDPDVRPALPSEPPAVALPIEREVPAASAADVLPSLPSLSDDPAMVEPIAHTVVAEPPNRIDPPDAERDIGPLLLVIGIIAGGLAIALGVTEATSLVLGARVMLAGVGAGMLLGRAVTTVREPSDPHPIPLLAPPVVAVGVAAWAAISGDDALASEAAALAGVIVTAAAIATWLVDAARFAAFAERAWIAQELQVAGRRAAPDEPQGSPHEENVLDFRPGEHVVVEAGETVPVDLRVTGSEVEVLPWVFATTAARRRDGQYVVAGARVHRGKLRGVCTWAGDDRAFARVLLDPRRQAGAVAPTARAARSLAERWALVAALVAALPALFSGRSAIDVLLISTAVFAGLATPLVGSLAAFHVTRGILLGLRRGIVYRSADAWERAARANVGIFSARGTLLLGEPELTEVEATGSKLGPDDVLALAAGAERGEQHPVATAIVRAAKARNVRPDGVRNTNRFAGLGVTAIASSGEQLSVGNRAFMLEQRISVALAEERLSELESSGRSVVLVAVGGRLAGVLAFQDGLRPGARAAVQHLLDAQVEPVLMSGDARETCEAIGRALDIDHIRPEVLPSERGQEVKRLIEAGMSVAVLGHEGIDDPALGAADVSVALSSAGSTPGEAAVALASDDVRDAALSLALAKRTRTESRVSLALAAFPAALGALVVAFGFLPPAYVPLAALLGGVMAVLHGRALDRVRPSKEPDVFAVDE